MPSLAAAPRSARPLATVFASPPVDLEPFVARLRREGLELEKLARPLPPAILRGRRPKIIFLPAELAGADQELLQAIGKAAAGSVALVLVGAGTRQSSLLTDLVAAQVAPLMTEDALVAAIRTAIRHLALEERMRRTAEDLGRRTRQYEQLLAVGTAMAAEPDIDALQDLILGKAREMTQADAGSLYLVRRGRGGEQELLFLHAQNDSVETGFRRQALPMTPSSIAGYVALTGQVVRLDDAYQIPPGVPYQHNHAFDDRFGYRTGSVLTMPLFDRQGEVMGVLQLMNRKRRLHARLVTPRSFQREVVPFGDEDERLLRAFAGHAGAVLETKLLMDSIENLFDGFIRAATTAVESRDPTTSGHSLRVAELSEGLARAIDRVEHGPLRDVCFDPAQIRELRYAAILHDFGKIGVREHVLVKSKKLYPWQFDRVEARFAQARRSVEVRFSAQKLEVLLGSPREQYAAREAELDGLLSAELAELDRARQLILQANEPTVLPQETASCLAEIATRFYQDVDGSQKPLLEEDELRLLSVRRGSLDECERREIESHVVHTRQFLEQIPWTRHLRRVPEFAAGHHERLDGSGYPSGLTAEAIPIETRILMIADVYDALVASDRPYKPAVPHARALGILRAEARAGKLDAALLDLYIEAEVYRLIGPESGPAATPAVRPIAEWAAGWRSPEPRSTAV